MGAGIKRVEYLSKDTDMVRRETGKDRERRKIDEGRGGRGNVQREMERRLRDKLTSILQTAASMCLHSG